MVSSDYQEVWNKIKQFLQHDETIDPVIFNNYVKNAYISDIKNNHCLIVVDSIFAKEILTKNLTMKIESILEKINNAQTKVSFIEPSDAKKEKQPTTKANTEETNINNFFFENFIKGESNNEAYQAALAITIEPGKYWNPLFIYGNSGLGKTHLLHAIKNEISRKYKNKKTTIYLSSEEFGRMVPEILQQNNPNDIEKFKNSFNEYDVLLVDDIQFLANRSKTNEIFFHIFNNFVHKQKQIVITSDKSPDELYGFEERNISRFQSGLGVGIDSPDFETALTILKEKIKSLNYDPSIFTEETLNYIAHNFNSDVRKLEGALNRLIFYSILYLKPNQLMSIDDVMKAFKTNTNLAKEKLTPKKIKKIVADYYNIPMRILNSSTRVKSITTARHIAMYLIKDLLNDSFVNIGTEFGGKDHTTVINAYNKVKKNMEQSYEFKKIIEGLKRECTKLPN